MEAAYRGSYDSLRGIEAPRSEGALRLLLAVDEPGDRMPGTEMADVLSERYPGEPAARDFQKLVDELTGPPAA